MQARGINIPQLQRGHAEMQTGLSVDKYARQAVVKVQPGTPNVHGTVALRNDGPTVAEFVAAGYSAANHPPEGFASRSSADEIAAAIAAGQGAVPSDGLTIPQLKAASTAKGVTIPAARRRQTCNSFSARRCNHGAGRGGWEISWQQLTAASRGLVHSKTPSTYSKAKARR